MDCGPKFEFTLLKQMSVQAVRSAAVMILLSSLMHSAVANAQIHPLANPANAANNKSIYLSGTLQLQGSRPKSSLQWKSHGVKYDSFYQIEAYSNRRNGMYQCTELVHRFLNGVYGVPTKIGIGLGHADVMLANIYGRFGSKKYRYGANTIQMQLWKNGSAQEPPAIGSAVNFASGSYGHVAIVRDVEVLASGSQVRVYLIEQHGFPRWDVGGSKPLRSVVFHRNAKGTWSAKPVSGIGQTISWLQFKVLKSKPME